MEEEIEIIRVKVKSQTNNGAPAKTIFTHYPPTDEYEWTVLLDQLVLESKETYIQSDGDILERIQSNGTLLIRRKPVAFKVETLLNGILPLVEAIQNTK